MTRKNTNSSSGIGPSMKPVVNRGLYVQWSRTMPSTSHATKRATVGSSASASRTGRRYTRARSTNSSGTVMATQAAISRRY
jgi:hypothetical protein